MFLTTWPIRNTSVSVALVGRNTIIRGDFEKAYKYYA